MATEEMKSLPKSTSKEPEFPTALVTLFQEVLELFNREGIPYAVAGAFALHEHTGIWRNTKDLDIFLPAEHIAKALQLLTDAGYETEIADDVWVAKVRRSGCTVDLITGMSNATVTVEMSWIERATECLAFGVRTKVLGAEEMVASKIFVSRRERFDGADVAHLIFKAPLDWDYLLRLLTRHGDQREMLFWHLVLYHFIYPAYTDRVPGWVWDKLVGAFVSAVGQPDPAACFRGSLVDENMFAIDVDEWGLPSVIERFREERQPKIQTEPSAEAA